MLPAHPPITLAVLAGGEGSRMGRPKGLLAVRGRPILHYLLDHFNWPGPTLLITSPGRQCPPGAERFDQEIADPVAGVGPIQGVITALQALHTPLLAVTTVDMPAVRAAHLLELIERLEADPSAQLLMTHRPEDAAAIEPFPLACRREALATLQAHLSTGRRSLYSMAGQPGVRVASVTWPPETWTNLNTPQDLERFLLADEKPGN